MAQNNIAIQEYLAKKGIPFKVSGKELIAACLFGDCDKNSKSGEAHLYFDKETGQYDCKKCGAKGNLTTLQKFFGDFAKPTKTKASFGPELVNECSNAIPDSIRRYLNARGISDALIEHYKIGYGNFYGQPWITIPI